MDSEEVLSLLFDYVGVGHFLYVAGVSRSWRIYYSRKARANTGTLMTTSQDAAASIACLEYGFANGLDFTSKFDAPKCEFGPGVCEWARHNGYPFFVWVATETTWRRERVVSGSTVGVFSSVEKAKEGALARRRNLTKERVDWMLSSSGFWETSYPPWRGCHTSASVKPFIVDGLKFSSYSNPLPLYATAIRKYSDPRIHIIGVFSTKKLANASIIRMTSHNREYTRDRKGFVHYECALGRNTTVWEGYLDGEGGRPGEIFETKDEVKELNHLTLDQSFRKTERILTVALFICSALFAWILQCGVHRQPLDQDGL